MNRAELLEGLEQAAANPPIAINVPEWGGLVHIRQLTVAEVEEQTVVGNAGDEKTKIARSVCRLLCDPQGKRLLDADNPKDVSYISCQPWPVLQKVLDLSRRHNGAGEEAEADAKNG